MKEKFQQQGAEGRVPSVAESIKFVHDEIIKWDGIITKAGIPKIELKHYLRIPAERRVARPACDDARLDAGAARSGWSPRPIGAITACR